MTQTHYDANDILMGGGGSPAWKFETPGETRTGIISAAPQARQVREYDRNNPGGGALKFFPSGDPIMGIVIELDTDERRDQDDDGKRTFYVEGRYIKEAVRNAVRASGAQRLEIGGRLTVKFTHRENPHDTGSRKYWEATYVPAANNVLMADDSAQYAPPPVAAAQPAPAQAQQYVQQSAPAAQAPAPAAAPAAADPTQPTAEQYAALKAAGVNITAVYAGYDGRFGPA